MKVKNKGRKIYKTKEKNYYGKSPVGKAFSVGLTVLLIGGIGFIGYSVAEPIINYTKKKGDNDVSTIVTTASEQVTNENGEVISLAKLRQMISPRRLSSTEHMLLLRRICSAVMRSELR